MGTQFRKIIARKLFEAVDNGKLNPVDFSNRVIPSLQLKFGGHSHFQISIKAIQRCLGGEDSVSASDLVSKLLSTNYNDSPSIASVSNQEKNLIFHLNQAEFIGGILNCTENPSDYKLIDEQREDVVVEFSSPNIAKPFHIGHLRSTIIGNFLSNIFTAYGHNVTRINYLGDWGTQFGYLKLGMEMSGLSDEEVAKDPIKLLFHAYVAANRKAESDPEFAVQARKVFCQMENGELPDLDAWQKYREYTVHEMEQLYGRLGVKFDAYEWESDYRKVNILKQLESLRNSGFLQIENDGKETFVLDEETRRPLLKSDGSTLYLTRDVAAVIDRQKRYKFHRMYYVAGNEQHHHFDSLFKIAKKIGVRNADKLYHVKFGKVEKMSTRKGNVVFLSDILDEIQDRMHDKQVNSPNTKIDLDFDEKKTADFQGVAALIAYELQRMPTASYEFNMDDIVKDATTSAKNFQMTYSRLCSLESNTGIQAASVYNHEYLLEPEAVQLALDIARLPDVLYDAKRMLGAHRLLNYMYSLNTRTKKALNILMVKGDNNPDRQAQRMLLFRSAKNALKSCMKLISVTPLEKV
ncbi:probable arginine--tRNA ligase, mitochondrial [Contarinia nasturtii]|uniref:probable arginine--tRNA ligase, mitochondrial n=1 Tax=Contarinia nasturtii TaxID=265458 RepID=UPI0012D39686|nr:probable arginine--tRNA ligase, mitochondrial [Contarinia nasturtii]